MKGSLLQLHLEKVQIMKNQSLYNKKHLYFTGTPEPEIKSDAKYSELTNSQALN